jgi:hypothetical protein
MVVHGMVVLGMVALGMVILGSVGVPNKVTVLILHLLSNGNDVTITFSKNGAMLGEFTVNSTVYQYLSAVVQCSCSPMDILLSKERRGKS